MYYVCSANTFVRKVSWGGGGKLNRRASINRSLLHNALKLGKWKMYAIIAYLVIATRPSDGKLH